MGPENIRLPDETQKSEGDESSEDLQKYFGDLTGKGEAQTSTPSPQGEAVRVNPATGGAPSFVSKLSFAGGFGRILVSVGEIFKSLLSRDRATQFMSLLFVICLAGACSVLWLGWQRMRVLDYEKPKTVGNSPVAGREEIQHINEFLRHQMDEAKLRTTMLSLGLFTIELKPQKGVVSKARVFNLAQLEITIQCDTKETRDFIRDHLTQANDQVTSVFTAIDRDEFLSKEGKQTLKKAILMKLNTWLQGGQVKNLFFDRLIVS